jgi:dUTP pyrophosphatase
MDTDKLSTGSMVNVADCGKTRYTIVDTKVKLKMNPGCEGLKPLRAHDDDAAFDVKSEIDIVLKMGEVKAIPVGFTMELQNGWEAQIRPRSGLALKHGIIVVNSPGTIDAGYRGQVAVILCYHGNESFCKKVFDATNPNPLENKEFVIKRGDRIAQMVISKIPTVAVEYVDELEDSTRGVNGLGSTGVK